MDELLKKIIHKSLGKLGSVQTVSAKCGMMKVEDSLRKKAKKYSENGKI